ncbi:MAG: hypothetical protein P1V51_23820, partial [Deltaproteobacteria bacterium]|nr:hypothetical protein [Deltaproteobacteria bacterium]
MQRSRRSWPLLLALSLLFAVGCKDTAPDVADGGPDGGDGGGVACDNGVQDGFESDIDCGGGICTPCVDGRLCRQNDDCASGTCSSQVCTTPASCTDGVKNGDESDADCGGAVSGCPGCADGTPCQSEADCQSGVCDPSSSACAAPSCTDGVRNGDETGTDCGGDLCGTCTQSQGCASGSDCASGVCDPVTSLCAAATCADGVQNQGELSVDCAGPNCPLCSDGTACTDPGICASGYCDPTSFCATESCTDGILNNGELAVDCGGPNCGLCPDGTTCTDPGICASGYCDPTNFCATESCTDGILNNGELAVDCGGPNCSACAVPPTCGPITQALTGALGDVVLSGSILIDTSAGTLSDASGTVVASGASGSFLQSQSGSVGGYAPPSLRVFDFASLTIAPGSTVAITGGNGLALVSLADLSVNAGLDLGGANGSSGVTPPGGSPGAAGPPGPGGWAGGSRSTSNPCSAGSGAAFGPGRGLEGGCG